MFISEKKPVVFSVSAVMGHRRNDRNLVLSKWKSRCVKAGEIHEILSAADFSGDSSQVLNNFAYLGFFEVLTGGVLEVGDNIAGKSVSGEIIGFDEAHMPNHLNILLRCKGDKTGEELGLVLGQKFTAKKA